MGGLGATTTERMTFLSHDEVATDKIGKLLQKLDIGSNSDITIKVLLGKKTKFISIRLTSMKYHAATENHKSARPADIVNS